MGYVQQEVEVECQEGHGSALHSAHRRPSAHGHVLHEDIISMPCPAANGNAADCESLAAESDKGPIMCVCAVCGDPGSASANVGNCLVAFSHCSHFCHLSCAGLLGSTQPTRSWCPECKQKGGGLGALRHTQGSPVCLPVLASVEDATAPPKTVLAFRMCDDILATEMPAALKLVKCGEDTVRITAGGGIKLISYRNTATGLLMGPDNRPLLTQF